jgi:DHA1 family bicyclomycin/chloramphenicol resistance-like MFS transporter
VSSDERHHSAADELAAPLADTCEMVGRPVAALDLGPTGGPTRPDSIPGGMSQPLLILILGGLTTLGPLSIDMYLPALPQVAQDLGAATSAVQLSLTACLAGMAAGQLVLGPVSDQIGRRRPLMIGLIGFSLVSLALAFVPSVELLVILRFVQGLFGAGGVVVSRAVVRDLYDGVAAARFFSRLMLVGGLAPVLAPVIGAQILRFTGWRGVFAVLAGVGVVLLAITRILPETWQPGSRPPSGLGDMMRVFPRLLRDRVFVGYALTAGCAFGAMFAYISGSPFVLQNVYGMSPQSFSLLFAINSVGLVSISQVNGFLVGRRSLRRLLHIGVLSSCFGASVLLVAAASDPTHAAVILIPLFVVVASGGMIMPNATALGLSGHPEDAGSAAALLGMVPFVIGATTAPLVGLGGEDTALPMALTIAVLATGAAFSLTVLTRPKRAAAGPA